ncbi:MAG: calcium-binding protein [Xanthobacteraceae bacterium]
MAYLSQSTYERIRDDPSMVVTFYNANRSKFISDLGMSGLSEDAVKAAWCTMVAYGLVPYGPGPQTRDLTQIINADTIACAHYVSLAWQLLALFGISTDNQAAVGWDDGAVSNHAQMLFDDGTSRLLLDPTIGLIVKNVTLEGLIAGTHYTQMKSFFSRADIPHFNKQVTDAIAQGSYHVRDAIFYVPTLDNWLDAYSRYQGLTIEKGNDRQIIVGSLRSDTIDGGAANDTLYGGKGNDKLVLTLGSDTAHGGKGNDTFLVNDKNDRVFELSNQGTDIVRSAVSYTLPVNVENLVLNGTAVSGTGNASNNTIYGNERSNTLNGLDGNDKLFGRGSNDSLLGGNGDDRLNGGAGADRLYGRAGVDTFHFSSIADFGTTGTTSDIIKDFSPSEDRIDLASVDANQTRSGNQAFEFIGTAAFSQPGQVRWFTSSTETKILLNTDRDSGFEAMIRIVGLHQPDASWFVL